MVAASAAQYAGSSSSYLTTAAKTASLHGTSGNHNNRTTANGRNGGGTTDGYQYYKSPFSTTTTTDANNNNNGNANNNPIIDERIRKLANPPPTSFTLTAALQLLQPKAPRQTAYLMDKPYLQNWLQWAYDQHAAVVVEGDNNNNNNGTADESSRVKAALRLAAVQEGLAPPNPNFSPHGDYGGDDPGPIDATALSVEGHPLLLSPHVRVLRPGFGGAVNGGGGGGSGGSVISNGSVHKPNPFQRTTSVASTTAAMGNGMKDDSSNSIRSYREGGGLGGGRAAAPDDDAVHYCVAVPEAFYETLRSVHGVLCDDGYSVSFQPPGDGDGDDAERVLLHHQRYHHHRSAQNQQQEEAEDGARAAEPRPIEFRRKLIPLRNCGDRIGDDVNRVNVFSTAANVSGRNGNHAPSDHSLMDKLLAEEQQRRQPRCLVEIHPLKLVYSRCTEADCCENNGGSSKSVSSAATADSDNTSKTTAASASAQGGGFGLVSRQTLAADGLAALLRAAVPHKATEAARLWCRCSYKTQQQKQEQQYQRRPTHAGDDYELVDLQALESSRLTLQDWADRISTPAPSSLTKESLSKRDTSAGAVGGHTKEVQLLIETRKSVNDDWPRRALELPERIRVGDYVDAQDVAGKWYEAVVREVDETSVKVHYVGWASRWDAKIRRRQTDVVTPNNRVQPPAPLWTRAERWRERLRVGDSVEVRDSSSLAERPKWYRGIIKAVSAPNDAARQLEGGAELEKYPVVGDPDKRERLIVLKRPQQLLVEVEQEKTQMSGRNIVAPTGGEDDLTPRPPFLRWVDLYGEEICCLGTHLKANDGRDGPVTLRYEYDGNRKPVEVLKSHPALGGTGFMRESLRGTPPAPGSVGLHNLGNSCFLNSTVQCLNHIEPLTQYFLQDRHMKDLNKKNPLGSGGQVALAYASLLKKMWGGEFSTLAPRMLKQTVASFAPQFDNSYQHDSQEFCQFLMDGLHEDLNRVKTKPYVEELEGFGMEDEKAAIESWRKHLLRHDSIVVDHCQGMHRSHLTCPRCGRESIKFDIFSSISLPLPTDKKRGNIQLEDCLEMFMAGEQLDERNAWYCPSCRQHVCALKMIALWSVPDILILHLKRFTFDTCMTSGGMLRSKIDDTVEFPIDGLDLTKHVLGPVDPDAPPIYKLFGVSEHVGPTANTGHYTATIRNSIDSQWYRCNDSHVGQTSGEASMTGGAYLLFYQRSKGISKWAGMEKAMIERNVNPYGGLETDQDGFTMKKTKKKKKKRAPGSSGQAADGSEGASRSSVSTMSTSR